MIGKIIGGIFKFFGWVILTVFMAISLTVILLFQEIRPFLIENISAAKIVIDNSTYDDFLTNETSYVFNDKGRVLSKLTMDQDSEYLLYNDIPRDVVNAFIAVEDRNFWNHRGIDLRGITRVIYRYFRTDGDEAHGASTITQQIARRTFLTLDKTIDRKIKEIFYSFEIEKKYTKEEIIEFYVNDIYYANGCYGISSASKFYFNKSADELSLSQIAYICAIPNSPSYYDPLKDLEKAMPRRDKILNDMFECNYITEEELNEALNEKIVLDLSGNNIEFSNYQTTYALKCAVEYFMKLNGFNFRYSFDDVKDFNEYLKHYNEEYEKAYKKISKGGYKIYTSLNDDYQNTLQDAIDNELSFDQELSDDGIYSLQSAATLIDNKTRNVVAIVGGRSQTKNNNTENTENSENAEDAENTENEVNADNVENIEDKKQIYSLNRAYQSYRQPGSSIKPLIVYTPGLEGKFMPNSVIYDISVTDANEKDADIEALTGTPYTYRRAIEQSKNGCAYYVFFRVGPRKGIKYIQNMNFKKIVPDDYFMASGLGGLTYGVTTEEMAGAYSTFVNDGIFKQPTCIVSILDSDGNEIFEDYEEKEVYKKDSARAILDILKGVITDGTAKKSVTWDKEIDLAGKTGTTNESKDGWFCGCSPYYTLAVWVGNDMPKYVEHLQGGTYPTKIWSDVMNEIHDGLKEEHFNECDIHELLQYNETYNSLLPGKDGDEEIIEGYTVDDFRFDNYLLEEANYYIGLLSTTAVMSNEDVAKGQLYYSTAEELVNQVKNESYKQELSGKLYAANTNFLNSVTLYQIAIGVLPMPQTDVIQEE